MSNRVRPPVACRICRSDESMVTLFRFGDMPVAGYLETDEKASLTAPRFPLALAQCRDCGLVQQAHSEAESFLVERVYSQYQPTYSMSTHVSAYTESFIDRAMARGETKAGETAVEIGSNDGRVLEALATRGLRAVGFEPALNLNASARE